LRHHGVAGPSCLLSFSAPALFCCPRCRYVLGPNSRARCGKNPRRCTALPGQAHSPCRGALCPRRVVLLEDLRDHASSNSAASTRRSLTYTACDHPSCHWSRTRTSCATSGGLGRPNLFSESGPRGSSRLSQNPDRGFGRSSPACQGAIECALRRSLRRRRWLILLLSKVVPWASGHCC
jgi:hypothetical protein